MYFSSTSIIKIMFFYKEKSKSEKINHVLSRGEDAGAGGRVEGCRTK